MDNVQHYCGVKKSAPVHLGEKYPYVQHTFSCEGTVPSATQLVINAVTSHYFLPHTSAV
jgi:hypothetical protein